VREALADILFATHAGIALRGDLYVPASAGPHPVVVAAPGGAWLRGDRSHLAHWGRHLADHGVAVFVIDYRRSTDGKIFPGNAQDVLAATRFIHENAGDFGLDPGRIGLLGASAGAHLAALVALAATAPWLADGVSGQGGVPDITAFVGVYGVYDLAQHWRDCQTQPAEDRDVLVDRMMGAALPDAPGAYRDGSPITYVTAAVPMETLLIWGDSDTTVLPVQSEALAAALHRTGSLVTSLCVPGAGHFWFSKDTDTTTGPNGLVAPSLVRFLQRAFGIAL
jgi:acetyl esterase/lipase